jgi:hypothetical protein
MLHQQRFVFTLEQRLFEEMKNFNQEYTLEQEAREKSIPNLVNSINEIYIK